MPEQLGFLTESDAKRVLRMVRLLETIGPELLLQLATRIEGNEEFGNIYLTPVGGIPARSGTTLGTAECTPYYIDDDWELQELLDDDGNSQTHTIGHLGASAVGASRYIQSKIVSSKKVADMEDCG